MSDMFCFQCEQTAKNFACEGKKGVCGKEASTSNLQDELTGALIGLARAAVSNGSYISTDRVMLEGLFTTITNVNFDDESINKLIDKVHDEKNQLKIGDKIKFIECRPLSKDKRWRVLYN